MSNALSYQPDRFETAIRRFDEENAHDPNGDQVNGVVQPRELVYAQRLTDWVLKLQPDASEALRLAARCQHLCRWMIPRSSHPMTKPGYLKWRTELKKFHAERSGAILREAGYPEQIITAVQDLNLKKNFPRDPDSQVLEDALCLVFLEHQFVELAARTEESKMLNALQKSWKKMSLRARQFALDLEYPEPARQLLNKALAV